MKIRQGTMSCNMLYELTNNTKKKKYLVYNYTILSVCESNLQILLDPAAQLIFPSLYV